MNVKVYMKLLEKAIYSNPDAFHSHLHDIETITMNDFKEMFLTDPSWEIETGTPLHDFIRNHLCFDEGDKDVLSVAKLRVIGLLWCHGTHAEKANELYEVMADRTDKHLAVNDKDYKPNFTHLFDFATFMVFKNDPQFEELDDMSGQYDDKIEEFLDEVYDAENRLDRKEWEKHVAK